MRIKYNPNPKPKPKYKITVSGREATELRFALYCLLQAQEKDNEEEEPLTRKLYNTLNQGIK